MPNAKPLNDLQLVAERRERAQEAARFLREGPHDPLFDTMQDLSVARRAYDSIVQQGNNDPDVIDGFIERLANAAATLDDVIAVLWGIVGEDVEEEEDPAEEGVDFVGGGMQE